MLKDSNDNLVGSPYDGTLKISDLNQSKNMMMIQSLGVNQKAQYTAVGDQTFDKQVDWNELLNY